MHKPLHERLSAWWHAWEEKLRRRWYLWPISFGIGLIEHRIYSEANEFLDAHLNSVSRFARFVIMALPSNPFLVMFTLALLIIVGLAIIAFFDVRRAAAGVAEKLPPTSEAVIRVSEPVNQVVVGAMQQVHIVINNEGCERLRELYGSWGPLIHFANEFLVAEVAGTVDTELKRYASRLLVNHVVPGFMKIVEGFDRKIAAPCSDLKGLVEDFRGSLRCYLWLAGNITVVGQLLHGNEWLAASAGYAELQRRHWKAVEELLQARHRQDIADIANDYDLRDLKQLFSKPA